METSQVPDGPSAITPEHDDAQPESEISRRGLLKQLGGAAAVGAVAAGTASVLSTKPAGATTGQPVLIGQDNVATSTAHTTTLSNPAPTTLSPVVFQAANWSTAGPLIPPTNTRIAASGVTSGTDPNSARSIGVWGQADGTNIGVVGRGGTTGINPLGVQAGLATGVLGVAADNGRGVVGGVNGAGGIGVVGGSDIGIGVFGATSGGTGVVGQSGTGTGVVAHSDSGYAIDATGSARLHQNLRGHVGAPTSGSFYAGEQIRDANGVMWICTADGAPGTWFRVATVPNTLVGGAVMYLVTPIRIFDTRNNIGGAGTLKLAAGASKTVQVSGAEVPAGIVPFGVKAIIGNLTVTATEGTGGYLVMYRQGIAAPNVASVNWFGVNQTINNTATAVVNPSNGQCTITNGAQGGSAPTHVIFDAVAMVQ